MFVAGDSQGVLDGGLTLVSIPQSTSNVHVVVSFGVKLHEGGRGDSFAVEFVPADAFSAQWGNFCLRGKTSNKEFKIRHLLS